jgi:hypothetical protein
VASAAARRDPPPKLLLAVLLLVCVWGVSPPWVGPWLESLLEPWLPWLDLGVPGVPHRIEVGTHAVPAVIAGVVAVAGLAGRLPLVSALIAVLAGLWMTATHVPLVGQARDGLVPWDAALFHSLPAFLVLGLSVAAAVWAWRADVRAEAQRSHRRSRSRAGR